MTSFNQTWAMTLLFLSPVLRQPVMSVLVSLLPFSFIVMFYLIGGPQLSYHALYGVLVVFSINVGIVSLPQIAVTYQTRRIRDIFVASPVGPGLYAVGMGLSRLCWVAPGLALVAGALLVTGGMPAASLPAVTVVLLFTWFTGVVVGLSLSEMVPNTNMISAVSNLVGLLISVLPPVYYPLKLVPGFWKVVAMLVPTTHAAELVRIAGGVAESTPAMVALHWSILGAYGLGFAYWLFWKSRWQEA